LYSNGLANTFANVEVSRPMTKKDNSKTRFLSVKETKQSRKMYEDTDYNALERNVKYIPWKGKKEEWYTWHKTFLVRALMRGYHEF